MLLEAAQKLGLVLRKQSVLESSLQISYTYTSFPEDILIAAERKNGTLFAFYGTIPTEFPAEVYIYNSFGIVEEEVFRLELTKILNIPLFNADKIEEIALAKEEIKIEIQQAHPEKHNVLDSIIHFVKGE